jgi:DNA-binding Xre family transcriptional regulator
MINKQQVEKLREERNIPKMEFYSKIGMTAKGYNQMFENDSMKLSTLEKIAAILDVPIVSFFDNGLTAPDPQQLQAKVSENRELLKENNSLKDEIRALEKNSALSVDSTLPKLKKQKAK